MAHSPLVNTTFYAGPEESVAVIDAYKKKSSAIVNSFQELEKVADTKIASIVSPPSTPAAMTNLISSVVNGRPVVNQAAVMERLLGTGTNFQSTFNTLQQGIQAGFGIATGVINQVTGTINGLTSILKSVDIKSISGIGSLVNKLSNGNFNLALIDKGALSGMVSGLVKEGSKLGLGGIFNSLSSVIQNKDILLNAAKSILPTAIKDIPLLKEMALSAVGKDLKNIMPNLVSSVVKNFKIPKGTPEKAFAGIYNDIVSSFTAIDPGWKQCTRGGNETLNVSSVVTQNNIAGKISDLDNLMAEPVLNRPVMSDFKRVTGAAVMAAPATPGTITATDDQVMYLAEDEDDEPSGTFTNVSYSRQELVSPDSIVVYN